MSIVHVLISPDPGFEQAWREAFAGAVEVYRFASLSEGMQRLTSAQAQLSLVVIERTAQDAFGPTVSQCVNKIIQPPLSNSSMLAGMQVVVVGGRPGRRHERVRVVSSRDAAIRLVKFGEVEATASGHPESSSDVTHATKHHSPDSLAVPAPSYDDAIVSSVISRIWEHADAAVTARPAQRMQPAQPARTVRTPRGAQRLKQVPHQQFHADVHDRPASSLFAHDTPHVAPAQPAQRVSGGGPAQHAAQFYQPGQPLPPELGGLEPAQTYGGQIEAQYRGDGLRGSHAHLEALHPQFAAPVPVPVGPAPHAPINSMHATASMQPGVDAFQMQPAPPAIAQQVGGMLYGTGAADPIMTFSQAGRAAAPGHVAPARMHAPQEPVQPVVRQAAPPSAPQSNGPQSGGMFSRMRARVAASERAPVRPSPDAIAAAMPAAAGQATPQSGASQFEVGGNLMARADLDSAASFG